MTSIYRQIGIRCERLFRRILMDALALERDAVRWSYRLPVEEGRSRVLTLDGRVPLDQIGNVSHREPFADWMRASADRVGVAPPIRDSLAGAVFEVRQGYKSKDSKRQNADIENASSAIMSALLPCALILSAQIDGDVLARYRAQRWTVLTGIEGANDPLISTYDFMRDVVGYDLAAFFRRNSDVLRAELAAVLEALLTPGSS